MKKVCCILVSFWTLSAGAQMNMGQLITRGHYYEMPFSETSREIKTKATIKGDQYDFMLDSGAPAFISKELQKKYKFKSIYKGKTEDASGNRVKAEVVVIDTINFGPFVFVDIPAVVIDMKESPLECLGLPGNIGSNIMRFLYVQFDKSGQMISFSDDRTLLKKQVNSTYPILVSGQSDVYFGVKLNDSLMDTVHFDSGDGQLYSMSKKAMGKYASTYDDHIIRTGYGTMFMGIGGAGEPFPQYVVKPQSIHVGHGDLLNGCTITIAGNDRSRMGRRLLDYGMLQINYPDSSYGFEAYPMPDIPVRADYGFHPVIEGDHLVVGTVWKNTPAEKAGLQYGDRILKFGDLDFATMSKCEVTEAARKISGMANPSVQLTYRRKKQDLQTITVERRIL